MRPLTWPRDQMSRWIFLCKIIFLWTEVFFFQLQNIIESNKKHVWFVFVKIMQLSFFTEKNTEKVIENHSWMWKFFKIFTQKKSIEVLYYLLYIPAIERPGLESQRSRKRHFFHRKIFKFFKYCNMFPKLSKRYFVC